MNEIKLVGPEIKGRAGETVRLEAEFGHQINGHTILMDVFIRFLHFLSIQCIAGLQTGMGIEINNRSYTKYCFSSQRLVNHKRNRQTEYLQTGELYIGSFRITSQY